MSGLVTQSKIPLKPFYTPDDVKGFDYQERLNHPGAYPYTRGRKSGPVGTGSWIQRELSGEGDPQRSNHQFKYLIEKGQSGIDIIGDSATQAALDPDHPFAANAVGTQGVSVCCLEDYRELYDGIPLDSLTLSHSLLPYFAIPGLYLVAKERGIPPNKLRGSVVQAPMFCEDCGYSVQMPLSLRLRLAEDSIEFATKEMPRFHSFLEDTYYISEAGLDSVEEMALGFVELRHIVRNLLRRGLDIDSFAPRIAILVNCRMDFFEEIAKVRATRRLFAMMMKEEFGAKDPRSMAVGITSHTSGLTLTAQQPFANIVRGTVQALALGLAGAQAIEISAFDEAYRTPSPESHLVGLRTQQVLHLESNIGRTLDPLGGSYLVEALTDEIEHRIRDVVLKIEAMGDLVELSERGWFRRLFAEATERYAREVHEGVLLKVGLNVMQIPDNEDRLLKEVVETKVEPYWDRIEKIRTYKRQRDQMVIKAVLQDVYDVAKAREGSLMYPIIKATEAGATMGEMAAAMRIAYNFNSGPFAVTDLPIQLKEGHKAR